METAKRLSTKKLGKKHCTDDKGCIHCCECWVAHKKEFEIKMSNMNQRLEEDKKKIEFLSSLNKDLKRKIDGYAARESKYKSIESMEQNLRKEIQEQLLKQRQVEDAIKEEKIKNLEEQCDNNKRALIKLQKKGQKLSGKIEQIQSKLDESQEKCIGLQSQNKQLAGQRDRLSQQLLDLYEEVKTKGNQLDQKNRVISQMQRGIKDIQDRFIIQKNKTANLATEKQILEIHEKNKDKYIQTLTKCTQENFKNITNLQKTTFSLKDMVGKLDNELHIQYLNEQYLRDRLIQTEQKAILNQEIARYHSDKVELMKNDLRLLKLRL